MSLPELYPICVMCKHYRPGVEDPDQLSKCLAFPAGIPDEIMNEAFDHRKPFRDEQILFELAPDADEDELREWAQYKLELTSEMVDANLGPLEEDDPAGAEIDESEVVVA